MPVRMSRSLSVILALAGACGLCLRSGLAIAQKAKVPEEVVYAIAERMPEFPGGTGGLRSYLMRNFQFPEDALDAVVNGPIHVSFIVAKDGQVHDAHIVRGQQAALDAEALRLVNAMPLWIPGQQHGKAVNVLYTMPIRFATPASTSSPPGQLVQAPPPK